MWNKQRRDEEPARPFNPTGRALHPRPPVSLNPRRRRRRCPICRSAESPRPRWNSATIGKAVKINGQIHSKEDLYRGRGRRGHGRGPRPQTDSWPERTVHATVKAREVVALGTIQGNVEATDRIEIRKDAKLVGDIRTARIVIEDGAYFKGSIDIVKPEAGEGSTPRPQQTRPQPAARAGRGGRPGTQAIIAVGLTTMPLPGPLKNLFRGGRGGAKPNGAPPRQSRA